MVGGDRRRKRSTAEVEDPPSPIPKFDGKVEVEEKKEIQQLPEVRARGAVKAAREAGDQRTDEQVFLDELLGHGWDKKN